MRKWYILRLKISYDDIKWKCEVCCDLPMLTKSNPLEALHIAIISHCKTGHVSKLPTESLTHWGRATHICVSKLIIIGSDNGLSPVRRQAIVWTMQCWNIVNWKLRDKLQWKSKRNSYISIHENAFQNVVWKMAAILSRPQCVNACYSWAIIITVAC